MTAALKLPLGNPAARKTAATAGLTPSLPVTAVAAGHIVKVCACCDREYAAAAWDALPLLGTQDDGVLTLALKNCACRTTMARVVSASPAVRTWPLWKLEEAVEAAREARDAAERAAYDDLDDEYMALLAAMEERR